MIVLSEYLQQRWKDSDVFETLFALTGDIYREKDGRKTFRSTIDGKRYFIKLYRAMGWIKLLKSIFRFRVPVLSAKNEWKAIQQLGALDIETMRLAGYGQRGWSPAHRTSFVITHELTSTLSLENYCRDWPSTPPDTLFKRALITKIAEITRTLHDRNLIHSDLYICHFLLDTSVKEDPTYHRDLRLYLIDLHRMRKRYCFQKRGKIKDVAALYFSSMDIGLTRRDVFRFMRIYQNTSIKSALRKTSFWRRVNRRAIHLYRKANGRKPSSVF